MQRSIPVTLELIQDVIDYVTEEFINNRYHSYLLIFQSPLNESAFVEMEDLNVFVLEVWDLRMRIRVLE